MRLLRPFPAITFIITMMLSVVTPISSQRAACVRPPAKQLADGATIVLTETANFPCTLEFVETTTVLRADSAGQVEDIGNGIVRGPDGRFYTTMSASGQVTVWNPNGSFLRNFGRVGQGPGEFARGGKNILFDRRGHLIVGDNNIRWSVFTPAYDFVATNPASSTGTGGSNSAVVLDDGTLLTTSNGRQAAYHIFDVSKPGEPPAVVRAFGPGVSSSSTARRLSYTGGNTFWSGPPDGAGLGYVIELWRTDGTLLRSLKRAVPWMPSGASATEAGRLPPPEMEVMHDDGTGVIFVTMVVPNKSYLTLTPADRRNRDPEGPANKAIDIYLEVIDSRAGVVLASTGPLHPAEASKIAPTGFFRASRQGYQRSEDAGGLPLLRIIEYQLFAR